MPPDVERGYLDTEDDGYLEGPYLGGEYEDVFGMQVQMVVNAESEYGMQAQMVINNESEYGMQAQMIINDEFELGQQAQMQIVDHTSSYGMQAYMNIGSAPEEGMQVQMVIQDSEVLGIQASMTITDFTFEMGMQANMQIVDQSESLGMEVKADTLRHALHGVYLIEEYLQNPYLVEQMCAFMGMQVEAIVNAQDNNGMQTEAVINDDKTLGQQALMIVNTEDPIGMQADQVRAEKYGMQSTMVIYNTTQLRVMWEFPSRGTAALLGLNWTASSQYPGDFDPENVNTDIVEQVYRSAAGSAALVELVCDTGVPQGVPIDTIAILGHNLTTSATVQVQGSNDNFATPANIVFDMLVERDNMYYISPSFPTGAGQNRYWKFIFQDPTNPAGYLEMGVIIFGVSEIFSVAECYINPIVHGKRHFKDTLETEGFTTVSNDRALKKFLRLRFEKLNYTKGNFRILDELMDFARTSLKSLIIPLPELPSRFAVFAKLSSMPEITSTYIAEDDQYVDIEMEWDESL